MLVATSVAARGLDVEHLVFNIFSFFIIIMELIELIVEFGD